MLLSSSSIIFSDSSGNLLKNGDFSNGANQWTLWTDKAKASLDIENGEAKISVTDSGSQFWSIGLSQKGFPLELGQSYTLTFQARANTAREIRSTIQMDHDPWSSYAEGMFFLSTKTAEYSYSFIMYYGAERSADLEIFLGARGAGTIYLDNVVLKKAGSNAVVNKTDSGVPEVNYPLIKPSTDRSNITIYEIIPGSYNGGSWYGGKCLKGITGRLDRIKELGVNCIWLTPIFLAEGMGYWPFDSFKINPKLGTLNDMKELVYEAHKRNIMVILDLVLNHTWTQHPFFQDVLKNKSKSKYKDYYLWKGKPGESDFVYYFDWKTIPNLNLKNPEVREYLYDVVTYWLKKLDIDGYRLDCAWALEERFPGFGAEMKKRLAALKPDIFLLAEGNVNEDRFFKNGYNSAYDWDLRGFGYTDKNLFPYLLDGKIAPRKLHDILTRNLPAGGLPLRFIENHDHPRSASLWGLEASKAAYTIVLTSKGYPLVLGGAEVGFAPPSAIEYSQDEPVVWAYNSPLFEYFKKLLAIRNQYLKNDLNQYWIDNDSKTIYSSLCLSGTNKLIVLANCSSQGTSATLKLSRSKLGKISELTELLSQTNLPYDGKGSLKVTLGGYETKILLVK
jgi:glycosidase